MTPIINYDAIVQELEKGLAHTRDMSSGCLGLAFDIPKHIVLKEYYTVGMYLPRQLGTSWFVLNEMVKNPNAACVVTSETHIEMQLSILKEFLAAAKEDRKVSVRGMYYYDLDSEIKKCLLEHPNLLADMKKRFITIRSLLKLMGEEAKFVEGMERIYLDGATYTFTKVKNKKFYEWLGNHSESYIQTWVIN